MYMNIYLKFRINFHYIYLVKTYRKHIVLLQYVCLSVSLSEPLLDYEILWNQDFGQIQISLRHATLRGKYFHLIITYVFFPGLQIMSKKAKGMLIFCPHPNNMA